MGVIHYWTVSDKLSVTRISHYMLPLCEQARIGSLKRMVQNVVIVSGTAIGSTVMSLWANQLPMNLRINWGITLVISLAVLILNILVDKKAILNTK